jgi:hypothetical protein
MAFNGSRQARAPAIWMILIAGFLDMMAMGIVMPGPLNALAPIGAEPIVLVAQGVVFVAVAYAAWVLLWRDRNVAQTV